MLALRLRPETFRDCYHHIAISILLTFNLSLEIEQICHQCSLSNLLDLETPFVSNVDCALLCGLIIFNGQQCLEALQVRKVTFLLGIIGEFYLVPIKTKVRLYIMKV
jgi:hypothetical protein